MRFDLGLCSISKHIMTIICMVLCFCLNSHLVIYTKLLLRYILNLWDSKRISLRFCLELHQIMPGKSHGRRSLVGFSPWGREELDTTEWLHFHFSLSCTGEGNGNSLQCSCLENPRDRGAWWAAVYAVAQSRTWLKWLSINISENVKERPEE